MAELLQVSALTAERMDRLVLQPMSGVEELRQWLYENTFHVKTDRLVAAGSRWYQVFCVQKSLYPDPWPEGFPEGCFLVGYRSFMDRDILMGPYCARLLQKRREQLKQAVGTAGEEKLSREAAQLEQILEGIKRCN